MTMSYRVRSRVLLVPFELPSTGPTSLEEFEAFEVFEEALMDHYYSSAVGWLVSLHTVLLGEGKCFIHDMKQELRDAFGLKIRNTVGWALCLFFAKQVSS